MSWFLARDPSYNVVKSEYQRFSNVLSKFEAEKTVGTSKANDSLQVMLCPFFRLVFFLVYFSCFFV